MATKQYISLRQVSLLKRVVEGMIKNGKPFGFDIESGYSGEDRKGLALLPFHPDWVFAGISFTNTDKGAFYVPIGHDNGDNIDDPLAAIVLLWELLNTGNGVPHNAMFEYIGLSRVFRQFLSDHPVYGEAVRKSKGLFDIRSDTMVEAHMLAKYEPKSAGGGVGVGLKELTKEVFGHQQVEFKELFPEEDSELGPGTKKTKMSYIRFNTRNPNAKAVTDYACEDALWTLGLHETHYPELKDSVLFQIEIKLLRVLAEMEIEGLLLDWDQIHSKTEELAEFRDKMNEEILQQLSEELGEVVSINLASPKQLGELLYDRLGIPEKKDRKTGKRTTSEPALRSLAKENKVVRDILLLREVAKLYGSYLNKYDTELNYDGTGRARPNHRSLGALTGRLSVDGVSYQQWPKPYSYDLSDGTKFTMNFRDLLIAPEDYRIIGFDYSQVELRVMAGLAQEHAMLSAFNSGEDIHKATASAMMGIPLSEVTKKLRAIGKTLNFAITYGSGAENIAEMLTSPDNPVTTEDAEELLKKYYQGFPALTGWMESKKVQGREQKYVETPFGRHFTVWEFIQASQPKNHLFSRKLMSKGDRMCVNAVVQGGAADIIKSSMVKAQHAIKKAGLEDKIRIIMTIHDALEFYVHKSISTQEVIDFLGPLVSPEVPGFPEILAEWHEGRSWGSVVELGLDEKGQISDYSYEDENNQKHVFKSLQEAYDHQDLPDEEKIPDDSIREEKVTETPKLIVITLVSEELPSGPQMMSLKNYLQDTPGLSSVRLDTSQGNFDLPEKVSSETLDKAQISVILGGAKVSVLDTAELSLEDIDLD